jgi:transcriptional regulator with XRE-family HTH domain
MENILMRFCREKRRYNIKTIAYKLGVSIEIYAEIEKGGILLTYEQAEQLAKIYNTDSYYFYNEAQQLDLLLTRIVIIKDLKFKIDLLQEKLKTMSFPVPND